MKMPAPYPPEADMALTIRNLQKTYKSEKGTKKHALKGIDLDIPKGSFFALLGPNGAGKSTLINILAGLTLKSSGSINISGYDMDEQPIASRKAIGVVPQELFLDPFFTVRETIENHSGYYGVPKGKRRTEEIVEALGLTQQLDQKPRSLSGGMQRRLLIAKALVHSPPVLILDEPTAGVDIKLRQQLWTYVKSLNEQGTTIILTTHYLEEAETLCNHTAIINHGEIVLCDRTDQLLGKLGHKEVELQCAEALSSIPESLSDFTVTTEGKTCTIRYNTTTTTVNDLLARVVESGIVIEDFSIKEAKLEDIFLDVTGS